MTVHNEQDDHDSLSGYEYDPQPLVFLGTSQGLDDSFKLKFVSVEQTQRHCTADPVDM